MKDLSFWFNQHYLFLLSVSLKVLVLRYLLALLLIKDLSPDSSPTAIKLGLVV